MKDGFEEHVLIDDNQSGSFVISGDIETLVTNGRAAFYLKKLNAEIAEGRILVGYDKGNKEKVLNNIQENRLKVWYNLHQRRPRE